MKSKLDETWHVVIISPTIYVVKFKDGYDKNQWYFVYEVVPFTSKHPCFYRKHPHYKYNILPPFLDIGRIVFGTEIKEHMWRKNTPGFKGIIHR